MVEQVDETVKADVEGVADQAEVKDKEGSAEEAREGKDTEKEAGSHPWQAGEC